MLTQRFITQSRVMRALVEQLRRFALTDSNALIAGEPCTGKNAVRSLRSAFASRRPTAACRLTLDALISVVLAPACAACQETLDHPTQGPVCRRCWDAILPLTPPLCGRCGDPLPTWRALSLPLARCPRCRRGRRLVDRARAIGAYDGALRAVVHALKYEGRRSLARPLGTLMRQRGGDILDGAFCAIPVPLHPSRRRRRGFNQAADLARYVEIPVVPALRRIRATPTQTGLPAARRHRNMRGAFAVTGAARSLSGAIVVLIDDVSTTGATLEACARVLKEAGVREVRALTAARVVGRDPVVQDLVGAGPQTGPRGTA